MALPQGCYSEMRAAKTKLLTHYPIDDANRISWAQFFQQYLPLTDEDPKTYSRTVRVNKPLHPPAPPPPAPPPPVVNWSATLWVAPAHDTNVATIEAISDSGEAISTDG